MSRPHAPSNVVCSSFLSNLACSKDHRRVAECVLDRLGAISCNSPASSRQISKRMLAQSAIQRMKPAHAVMPLASPANPKPRIMMVLMRSLQMLAGCLQDEVEINHVHGSNDARARTCSLRPMSPMPRRAGSLPLIGHSERLRNEEERRDDPEGNGATIMGQLASLLPWGRRPALWMTWEHPLCRMPGSWSQLETSGPKFEPTNVSHIKSMVSYQHE